MVVALLTVLVLVVLELLLSFEFVSVSVCVFSGGRGGGAWIVLFYVFVRVLSFRRWVCGTTAALRCALVFSFSFLQRSLVGFLLFARILCCCVLLHTGYVVGA